MSVSDLQLMARAITTGFLVDTTGRLHSVNEPGDAYASPRFFMGRTPDGNIWRFRHDVPASVVVQLDALCDAEPVMADVTTQTPGADVIRTALQTHAPIEIEERGPAYLFPDDLPSPTDAVLIDNTNVQVLKKWFPWRGPLPTSFDFGPFAGTIVDGSAVSLCWCSRLALTGANAGVETIEAFRGRGYAAQAVAAWAIAVRQRGLVPFYDTSWENRSSQAVARRLGMRRYGEMWSVT